MDMLLNMPKLKQKFKKLKKEGGPQFLSLTFYLQVKWLVQPSLVFTPPPDFLDHKYRIWGALARSSNEKLKKLKKEVK